MKLVIYPPIGIARVGNSLDEYFIAPESQGAPRIEFDSQGREQPVELFKDAQGRIKRQGARFRLFQILEDGADAIPFELPEGATIRWSVHLVNAKAGVVRSGSPPRAPSRPRPGPDSDQRTIDAGQQQVSGASSGPVVLDRGDFIGEQVSLGDLRTDKAQNLIVLGGWGVSKSPESVPIKSFYTNDGWHDDSSDGPVRASVVLADGSEIEAQGAAWVIVGPPDYAPAIEGLVTLYDVLLQVGVDHLGVEVPGTPSFVRDIKPLIQRTHQLRWVNSDPNWEETSVDWQSLSDTSDGARELRDEAAFHVSESRFVLREFMLTATQLLILKRFVAGDFDADWPGAPSLAGEATAGELTRSALDSTVGQGFFPGIEAGILLKDATLYAEPFEFRLNEAIVKPGWITALMAVPWQADFLKCSGGWWPSQRPGDVRTDVAAAGTSSWDRQIDNHQELVERFGLLGFVAPREDSSGNIVFVEVERADDSAFDGADA